MAKFEKVSRFSDIDLVMPVRKTADSAGYDLVVAEDVVVPSYKKIINKPKPYGDFMEEKALFDLSDMELLTKSRSIRPTLVSTGMKCKLDKGTYLELSVRSSTPLKYWLIMANGVGIIDADYYNNPSNEGEMYLQLINLAPYDIQLHRGDVLGQGIIKQYLTTEDDVTMGERVGGFGSTNG